MRCITVCRHGRQLAQGTFAVTLIKTHMCARYIHKSLPKSKINRFIEAVNLVCATAGKTYEKSRIPSDSDFYFYCWLSCIMILRRCAMSHMTATAAQRKWFSNSVSVFSTVLSSLLIMLNRLYFLACSAIFFAPILNNSFCTSNFCSGFSSD